MGIDALAELQDMLYAQDRWAVLVIFQAMDAAGKDGAIKHVMSGINPQGCQVYSFKSPSSEDLDHDFLWRCLKSLPERGRIGIFNRSYYEEVLVVRVHPEFLAKQKVPPELMTKDIWKERYRDIRDVERYLARNGVALCKVFSVKGRAEETPSDWNPGEVLEFGQRRQGRAFWNDYMDAYENMTDTLPRRTGRCTSCRPTTNCSPVWSSPRPSSKPWPGSISAIRRSGRRR